MIIKPSPMDYYFYRRNLYTIQFVFEYQGHLSLEKLTQGVQKIPQFCMVVGSRLKIISDRQIILETGYPIPLRVQHLNQEAPDIEKFLDPIVNAEGEALAKLLVTYTTDRTFVGVSFSHFLGDGSSFFQFLITLSNIINDKPLQYECCNERDLLQVDTFSRLSLFESTGYVSPRPPNPISYELENLRNTFAELSSLKEIYKPLGVLLSSNDLIMADLVKRFYRHIPLHEGQFIVRCPVDYRSIYELPKAYFGNAVRDAVACFDPDEIDSLSVGETAVRIKDAIQAIDKSSVRQSLVALLQLREEHGIEIFENVGCPGLLVSNLSKLPIQLVDLGAGAPIQFHHASLNPRLALILPDDGGLKVTFKRPLSVAKE